MAHRRVKLSAFLLAAALLLAGCSQSVKKSDIADRTYIYENQGSGGSFSITLNRDGTFQYYEGPLSSYIGMGKWSLEDDIVTLSDTSGHDFINRFQVRGDALVFLAEGSSNFLYVKVADGETFSPERAEPK